MLLLAAVAPQAAPAEPYRFEPIDAYLKRFGMEKLKPLDVRFGEDLRLTGDSHIFNQNDADFKVWKQAKSPTVSWSLPAGTLAMVLFLDLDAGGRPATDDQAGRLGPYVHSLWADCDGDSLESCKQVVRPYKAPGNSAAAPNRYTYLLLQQAGPAKISPKARVPLGPAAGRASCHRSSPVMCAKAALAVRRRPASGSARA